MNPNYSKLTFVRYALGCAFACLCTSSLTAHPFHTTTAEMEFNAKTGRLEVSLRVLASDLEEALAREEIADAKQKPLHSGNTSSAFTKEIPVHNAQGANAHGRVNIATNRDVD